MSPTGTPEPPYPAWPAVYNGDIFTPEDAAALCRDYPGTDAAMLVRGLMRDPALLRRLRGGPPPRRRSCGPITTACWRPTASGCPVTSR